MLMSMTGFGRGQINAPFGRLIVEIQSINRKHFEMQAHLPKELSRFESEVRKKVAASVFRGHINVRIQLIPSTDAVDFLLPDSAMLQSFKQGWEKIAKQLKLDPKAIDLPFLVQNMPAMQKGDLLEEKDVSLLHQCVEEALSSLLLMKREEGRALVEDISARLKKMKRAIALIEELSPDASHRMREKLKEKMEGLFGVSQDIDDRVLREFILFAEKVDISEEITRMKSHFSLFEEALRGKESSVGKKMEFIVQEMGREINTIGSKSAEVKISILVVEFKSELEKIREQIQNIE